MNRYFAACALLLVAAWQSTLLAAEKKPHVLFIAVDDMRPELNCYGASHIKSPNIDRLAAGGVKFNRAYCQQAVCSPSRTSLLTGLRPDSTKVFDLQTHFRRTIPNVVTLPQHFKNHGYHTESMGKIYHGGLDDAVSWSVPSWTRRAGGGGAQKAVTKTPEQLEQQAKQNAKKRQTTKRGPPWEATNGADNELLDGQVADHAVERLQALAKADQPFFLAVGFVKPHLPFIAPKRYFDLYDPKSITVADNPYHPKGSNQFTLANSGELHSYAGVPGGKEPITDELARQLRHAYYSCVSYTDANIGRVVDELDRLGLRENTIIVLWGDHGWKLGEHGEWCKHSNMENDTHVPMFIDAPGMKAGQTADSLVEFVDIYPTLVELAGLPRPEHLEGASLVPVLKDATAKIKTAAFSQYPRGKAMGYSLRTDRYRLTRWVDRENTDSELAVELYDHRQDPAENTNVAGENPQLVKQLTQQLQAGWRAAQVK